MAETDTVVLVRAGCDQVCGVVDFEDGFAGGVRGVGVAAGQA